MVNVKRQACKHTTTAHITPEHDRKYGKMRLLIKSKPEGEATAWDLGIETGKVVTAV